MRFWQKSAATTPQKAAPEAGWDDETNVVDLFGWPTKRRG
jgi:hypothetical protein